MWTFVAVAAAWVASTYLVRRSRAKVDRAWQALAAAVPDQKALPEAGYRESPDPDESPGARKALALLPESRAAKRYGQVVGWLSAPLTALAWGLFPIAGLGAWSAAAGALFGLTAGAAVLDDQRTGLGLLALALGVGAFSSLMLGLGFPVGAVSSAFAVYIAGRKAFDFKDAAGIQESNRERMEDPKYLAMSWERRAAGIIRSRGTGSSQSSSSARDNLTAT